MSEHEIVQEYEFATQGEVKDLCATVVQAVPTPLLQVDAHSILGRKTEVIAGIRGVLAKYSTSSIIERAVAEWRELYADLFSMPFDPTGLVVPKRRSGFERLLIGMHGVTTQRAYNACADLFPCWKYTSESLDEAVPTNERDPRNGSYAIWVRNGIEADEVQKNKSANDISRAKLATETLLERLFHELKYFRETGEHLDVSNVTVCAGSRDSDGNVPGVDWHGSGLEVDYYGPGNANDGLRVREVVS